jgi:hypothetical protein
MLHNGTANSNVLHLSRAPHHTSTGPESIPFSIRCRSSQSLHTGTKTLGKFWLLHHHDELIVQIQVHVGGELSTNKRLSEKKKKFQHGIDGAGAIS